MVFSRQLATPTRRYAWPRECHSVVCPNGGGHSGAVSMAGLPAGCGLVGSQDLIAIVKLPQRQRTHVAARMKRPRQSPRGRLHHEFGSVPCFEWGTNFFRGERRMTVTVAPLAADSAVLK